MPEYVGPAHRSRAEFKEDRVKIALRNTGIERCRRHSLELHIDINFPQLALDEESHALPDWQIVENQTGEAKSRRAARGKFTSTRFP